MLHMNIKISFLKSFLDSCKKMLEEPEITVCIGNEACDLDSFISSVALSIKENCIMCVNMRRSVFEKKGDLKILIDQFNIDIDDLIFLERPAGKYPLQERINRTVFRVGKKEYKLIDKKVNLLLVDHHRPVAELSNTKLKVVLDHHIVGSTAIRADILLINITVGSCCTLVSNFMKEELDPDIETKHIYLKDKVFCNRLAEMLQIPIIFDTKGLTKVTSELDKEVFDRLAKITGRSLDDVLSLTKMMKKARKNDSELENDIILYKDYKRFDHMNVIFGYSTVKYDYNEWYEREKKKSKVNDKDFMNTIFQNFISENGLNFLVVNRKFKQKRFLILINCPIKDDLIKKEGLQLKNIDNFQYYEVDVKKSRKVLAPVMKKLLDNIKIK